MAVPSEEKKHYPWRKYGRPQKFDKNLGPLKLLPGVWKSQGRGWNMIALPFSTAPSPLDYRLLLNQYNETLRFDFVDDNVPNRGVDKNFTPTVQTDQFIVTLDYQQTIEQVAATDSPDSGGLAGKPGLAIHHEPGLWLHMKSQITDGFDIARLATIPHGDAVLALGQSSEHAGASCIPHLNTLPEGVTQDVDGNPYLRPYKQFHDSPFKGNVTAPGFPGFDPTRTHVLLELANQGVNVVKTTTLTVDTTNPTGGISNIPFIVRKANAAAMKSIFWIQELAEKDKYGDPKLRLQYLQVVILDFFPRRDGLPPGCCPGLIRWPHVSINTLEKDVEESKSCYA
ncbi:heme-binding protein [Nitrospira sp. CMX1]